MRKKITGLVLSISVFIGSISISGATAPQLMDISKHWAKASIEQAVTKGYVSGYPEGTFQPDNQVTRAEFIKMVTDALQLPHSISGDPWYQPYVAAALEFGIVLNSEFTDYAHPISRLEIMRIVSRGLATDDRYQVYLDAFSGLYNGDIPFVDYRDIEGEDVAHVAMVIGTGLVSGYPDFSLGFNKTATRAEAVVMINNFLNIMLKSPESFRGLQELKEVAETGTNAKTVSQLIPSQNFKNEPISISTKRYVSTIKRAYVLPNEGQLSIFDRKMMWDRMGLDQNKIDSTPYFVLVAHDVLTKERFHFDLIRFSAHVNPMTAIRNSNKELDRRATEGFGYFNPMIAINGIAPVFEKEKYYEVFTYSEYDKYSANTSTGMFLGYSDGGRDTSRYRYSVFTSSYIHKGW